MPEKPKKPAKDRVTKVTKVKADPKSNKKEHTYVIVEGDVTVAELLAEGEDLR